MKHKIIIAIILIVWLFPTLANANANIKIQTLPDHQVQITLFNEVNDDFLALERFEGVSDENGQVSFTSSVESSFNLLVFVRNSGETVLSEKYLENYNPNENIYLKILPEKSFLSGNFVKITTYTLLGILVSIFAYVIFRKTHKISSINNQNSIKFEIIRDGKKVNIGKINLRRGN